MPNVLRQGIQTLRNIAGENSGIEKFIRHQYSRVISQVEKQYSGKDYTIFWNGQRQAKKVGIFMNGGCDLPSIFTAVPDMQAQLNGTACLIRHGAVSDSVSSVLLQALEELPDDLVAPVVEKLELSPDYFKPRIFEKEFTVQGAKGSEIFDKNVIIFSIGPDVVRSLYRHRKEGYLVDPGGFWLNQDMKKVLSDLSMAKWFSMNFRPAGKIKIDQFSANFEKIVQLLHKRTNAHILILNVLTVEPGSRTHNYQHIRNADEIRRREFNMALVELNRRYDFSIVDVDRALKQAGLRDTQMDFAHYPDEVYPYIGQEVYRILRDLEVFA